MKIAFCKLITGRTITVNYDESMTTRAFKEMVLSSCIKDGASPADAILSEFKMTNSSAPGGSQELIANETTMASVPMDHNVDDDLEICWVFNEAAYNARIKEENLAFLQQNVENKPLKVAYCRLITGRTIAVNYTDDMTIAKFKKIVFLTCLSQFPDDVFLSEFKMMNNSVSGIPQEIIANEATMASVPIDDDLEISWVFDKAAYNARPINEKEIAFSQGLHTRLGQESSILKMKKNELFDKQVLGSIFGFLKPLTTPTTSECKVKGSEEEIEQDSTQLNNTGT